MVIELHITADDCGMSEGINRMARELHDQGILHTASVMTNMPASDHAFACFADVPALELGVHLNLSDGTPLTDIQQRELVSHSNGRFRNQYFMWAQLAFASDAVLDAIRDELTAQIEAFLAHDRQPTHLTTHCHFHIFPQIRAIVHDLAERYDVCWVRTSDLRLAVVPYNLLVDKEPATPPDEPLPFVVPDYLVHLRDWLGSDPQALVDEILTLQGTVEVIVHPAPAHDPTFPAHVSYTPPERYPETRYLRKFYRALQTQLGTHIRLTNALSSSDSAPNTD